MKYFTFLSLLFILNYSTYSQSNYQWDMPGAVWTHLTLANTDYCGNPSQVVKRTLKKSIDSVEQSLFGSFFYNQYIFSQTPMYPDYNVYNYNYSYWTGYVDLAFHNDIIYLKHNFISLNGNTIIAEDTLVNFNASIGDTWAFHDAITDDDFDLFSQGKSGRTTVLDTGSRMINSEYLKWINVSHQPIGLSGMDTLTAYSDTIFEKIGAKLNLFPSERFYYLYAYSDTPTFACYVDNSFPEYVEKPNVCSFHLGIEKVITETITIYPNPVNDIVHIKIKMDSKINQCTIHSLDGRIVRSFEINTPEININISDLTQGVYLFTFLENGTQVQLKRIYKIR